MGARTWGEGHRSLYKLYPLGKAGINFTFPLSLLLQIHPLFRSKVLVEDRFSMPFLEKLKNPFKGHGVRDPVKPKREPEHDAKDGAASSALPATPSTGISRLRHRRGC